MVYLQQNVISILVIFASCFLYFPSSCLAGGLVRHYIQGLGAKSKVNFLTEYCSEGGDYQEGSTFEANLNLLLNNLTLQAQHIKFHNLTVGESSSRVYGLFLCRGDKSSQICRDCVKAAEKIIQMQCPFNVEAIVWYEECILRYANSSMFGVGEVAPVYYFHLGPLNYDNFDDTLMATFRDLATEVVQGNSSLAFARKDVNVTDFLTLDCYVDCTPDITKSDCKRCLGTALARFETFKDGGQYAVLLQPSCRLRYEFHGVMTPDPSSPPDIKAEKKGLSNLHTVLLLLVSSAATTIFMTVAFFLYKQKIRGSAVKSLYQAVDDMESIENLQFEFSAIKRATENFLADNQIGQGGFGAIYKGTLPNGELIAVKRLKSLSKQGSEGFKTEACLLAKLQHKNLIKLFGFCIDGVERLLVYELLPNKSLDRFLSESNRGCHLNWETRYKIILGVARGMHYLHEDSRVKIIHRDLKASNILLDADLNPKISDFGLAKLFQLHQTQGNTSTVVGTYGYMAPEYIRAGHFSARSDVYSFGVILLELVSGSLRYSVHTLEEEEDLLSNAWKLWSRGDSFEFVDSTIRESISTVEAARYIQVGLLCVQENPSKRPDMETVITMLNSPSMELPPPTAPWIFEVHSSNSSSSAGTVEFESGSTAFEIDVE